MNARLAKPIPAELVYSEMAVDEGHFPAAVRAAVQWHDMLHRKISMAID
jgi:hypothetical protein